MLILGSKSPRRKEILEYFQVPFIQVVSHFDEDSILFNGDPEDYVQTLALKKSEELHKQFPEALILTADTTVFCQGKIYNKPNDLQEARTMLQELCGKWQTVYTGVVLRKGEEVFQQVEATHVLMNPRSVEQINAYLAKNQWQDKAGGYTIQEGSGLLVNKIDGCYYNVMGLPINTVAYLFEKHKIPF
jgi:septum formation protein